MAQQMDPTNLATNVCCIIKKKDIESALISQIVHRWNLSLTTLASCATACGATWSSKFATNANGAICWPNLQLIQYLVVNRLGLLHCGLPLQCFSEIGEGISTRLRVDMGMVIVAEPETKYYKPQQIITTLGWERVSIALWCDCIHSEDCISCTGSQQTSTLLFQDHWPFSLAGFYVGWKKYEWRIWPGPCMEQCIDTFSLRPMQQTQSCNNSKTNEKGF